MSWTEIKANPGMGLEHQHLLRWHGKPVCALKGRVPNQHASLLWPSGISALLVDITAPTLEEAKRQCEVHLERMGWEQPAHV